MAAQQLCLAAALGASAAWAEQRGLVDVLAAWEASEGWACLAAEVGGRAGGRRGAAAWVEEAGLGREGGWEVGRVGCSAAGQVGGLEEDQAVGAAGQLAGEAAPAPCPAT